jgi:hypothetical protein
MKYFFITFLMCLISSSLFSQFNPSNCFAIGENYSVRTEYINNNSQRNYSFDKKYLACNNVNYNYHGGFSFKAAYSVSNLVGPKEIFSLRIGSNVLLSFKIVDKKIEVLRDVIFRPCTTWSNGVCQTFGYKVKGVMTFSSWDDQLVEDNTGWIWIKVLDDSMRIRVSKEEDGPYKTEFNYEGLHLSGVNQELLDNVSTNNANIIIPSNSSTTNVSLSTISFSAGIYFPELPVNIDDSFKSPETNFPPSAARTSEDKVNIEEIIAEQDIISTLLLYPNPSKDGAFSLKFGLNQESPVNFEIANLSGQVVYQKQNQFLEKGNHTLQFGKGDVALAAGFYIIKVVTNEYSKSLKLVVE